MAATYGQKAGDAPFCAGFDGTTVVAFMLRIFPAPGLLATVQEKVSAKVGACAQCDVLVYANQEPAGSFATTIAGAAASMTAIHTAATRLEVFMMDKARILQWR